MSLSWKWKLRLINGFCQGYFFAYAAFTLIVSFSTTFPDLFSDDLQRLFLAKALCVFVFFNMFANYIYIRLTASHSFFKPIIKGDKDSISESLHHNVNNGNNNLIAVANLYSAEESDHKSTENIGGWSHCKDCCDLVPPRAKHCPLCDACILKRDHHCFFAGCCVGFHNQRYFIMFCMYGGIGGLYSLLVTHFYLCRHYEGLQNWGIFAYILPLLLWFWFTGSTSGSVVLMTLFLYWNCLSAFTCLYYFAVQVFLICRGQTKYECIKGIHLYRGHFWLNMKSVFGPLWYVGFLIPVPFLEQYGDGKNWEEFVPNKLL